MNHNPHYLTPLARRHRSIFFYLLLLIFVLMVPVFVFYANGYRFTAWSEELGVQVTGGMYIGTQVDTSTIFLNDAPVRNTRFFRRATYVQGLVPGMHTVSVQGEGLQTWVKHLPVYPQFVTEFATFTLPVVPQLRPITPFLDSAGTSVVLQADVGTTTPFAFASSSRPIIVSNATRPVSYQSDSEYEFLTAVFAEIDATRPTSTEVAEVESSFRFATTSGQSEVATTTFATTTVTRGGLSLVQRGEEVVAVYQGALRTIPHYFCVPDAPATTTAAHYGRHVAEAVTVATTTATTTITERGTWFLQTCRTEIRIDRKGQTVHYFNFVPTEPDLVLLHLDDGVYVTEIDDRAWQNHQLLYPHSDVTVLAQGGQIFVRDGDLFAELFITLPD